MYLFNIVIPSVFKSKGPSFEVHDREKKMEHIEEHEEDESKALISDLSDLTSASTSRRQLDAGTLDAKVVKALKKQEEKREKRASRKKEVSIKIELLNNSKRIEKFILQIDNNYSYHS